MKENLSPLNFVKENVRLLLVKEESLGLIRQYWRKCIAPSLVGIWLIIKITGGINPPETKHSLHVTASFVFIPDEKVTLVDLKGALTKGNGLYNHIVTLLNYYLLCN